MAGYLRIALLIIGIGISVAAYQSFWVKGLSIDTADLAYMAGRALALILLPMMIALHWHFTKLRRGAPVGSGPVIAAILILVAVSIMSTVGLKADQSESAIAAAAGYEYHGKDCDLAVTFPAAPKITKQQIVGSTVESEQAELIYGDALLRAECIPVRMQGQHTEEAVADAVGNFATANGFQYATVTTDHDQRSVSALVRGTKSISGKQVTFETRMIVTESSTLSVITGGESSGYPQAGIVEFQHSVHPAPAQ